MFLFKKRDTARQKTIERLYGAIVAQARTPDFYLAYGVPDTVEGRFDLLVLHLHLVTARLSEGGESGNAIGQALLDHFFEDMDGSLREIGIGDLTVPKKMRTLAEAYLGRSAAYGAAISANDEKVLAVSLARNVLAVADPEPAQPLAAYAFDVVRALKAHHIEAILGGDVGFPETAKAAAHAR